MSVIVRHAVPADLERLLPLLDQEFVFGKGRRISLAQRFGEVFRAANAGNIFLCEEGDAILSALAVKRFDWLQHGQAWRGAMIGAVYTDPRRRGEGLASRVLQRTEQKLRSAGIDFAVLWTAQPAFYTRLGWTAADCGVLGETANDAGLPESADSMAPDAADIRPIESIRQRWLTAQVARAADDYRQLPLPAENVELIWHGQTARTACYALLGHAGDTSILYEMVGNPDGFTALWAAVRSHSQRRLLINDSTGSGSHAWLAQDAGITWQDKKLAMWLPLSERMEIARVSQWYIPYFDRI